MIKDYKQISLLILFQLVFASWTIAQLSYPDISYVDKRIYLESITIESGKKSTKAVVNLVNTGKSVVTQKDIISKTVLVNSTPAKLADLKEFELEDIYLALATQKWELKPGAYLNDLKIPLFNSGSSTKRKPSESPLIDEKIPGSDITKVEETKKAEELKIEGEQTKMKEKERLAKIKAEELKAEDLKIETERKALEKDAELAQVEKKPENISDTKRKTLEELRLEKARIEAEIRKLELEEEKETNLKKEKEAKKTKLQEAKEKKEKEKNKLKEANLEKERLERERKKIAKAKKEKEKVEAEQNRLAEEKLALEKIEKERLEKEKVEAENKRLEQKWLEKERIEAEQEKIELARIEQEKIEQERIEQERLEQEKIERLEQERLVKEALDEERQKLEAASEEAMDTLASTSSSEEAPVDSNPINEVNDKCSNFADIQFTNLEIIKQNKKQVTIRYVIKNLGGSSALLAAPQKNGDNLALRAHLCSSAKLTRGAITLGGSFLKIAEGQEKLNPGESYTGILKLQLFKLTKFTPYLVLQVDPYQKISECDETNNIEAIILIDSEEAVSPNN